MGRGTQVAPQVAVLLWPQALEQVVGVGVGGGTQVSPQVAEALPPQALEQVVGGGVGGGTQVAPQVAEALSPQALVQVVGKGVGRGVAMEQSLQLRYVPPVPQALTLQDWPIFEHGVHVHDQLSLQVYVEPPRRVQTPLVFPTYAQPTLLYVVLQKSSVQISASFPPSPC